MIIDSHIHLYPASEQEQLAWLTGSDHPLHGQHSVDDYLSATRDVANLRGFIFVETDRKHDLETEDFDCPLQEVSCLARIAEGLPREGEGHNSDHAQLVLGIVPWAPLSLGPQKLAAYVEDAKRAAGSTASKIVGFRYLIQDKPLRTCTEPKFIESLKWLGRNGYTFDVGIDMASEPKQGKECVAMMRAAHEGVGEEDQVVFVVNHIVKPAMSDSDVNGDEVLATEEFRLWKEKIGELSRFGKTYMKLSGCLSQMKAVDHRHDMTPEELYELMEPWLSVVLEAFGPRRIMWGSDWPVCEVSPSGKGAWETWRGVCEAFVKHNKHSEEDANRIWFGTAVEAYELKVDECRIEDYV